MKKEELKSLWEDHKKEIVVGTGVTVVTIVATVIGVKRCRKPSVVIDAPTFRDVKLWEDMLNVIERERDGGSKMWLEIPKEDIAKLNGCDIVRDASGKLFKMSSMIAFGNEVEEP